MKRSRFSLSSMALVIATAVIGGLCAPDARAQYEYEWGTALMEKYRYDDLAEAVFTDLSKSSAKEQKLEGLLGLSSLKRRAARRTEDVAIRAGFNDEALKLMAQVAQNLDSNSVRYWETRFQLADTLEEVVTEDIELIKAGRVPQDKLEDYRKRNRSRLDQAQIIYTEASSEYKDSDQDDDPERWALGQKSTLMSIVLELRRSELMATDASKIKSPLREAALNDMVEQLGDFALENEGVLFGIHGYYYLGRVTQELNKINPDKHSDNEVLNYYAAIPMQTVVTPDDFVPNEDYPTWTPLSAGGQWLVQQAYLSIMQFTNGKGLLDRSIAEGEKFRSQWDACGYTANVYGQLTLIELARAYQNSGRDAEALSIAADISARGGYQGQQADKLMSVIIRTSTDKSRFAPTMLAAGANGAYAAGRKNPAKYHEAIELYQAVLANLDQIPDEIVRNDLGREAGYRIGRMLDSLGRKLESAVALQATYERFNNDKIEKDKKLNGKIGRYWRAVLREFRDQSGSSDYAKGLLGQAESYLINNAPKGGGSTSTLALAWRAAENARRGKQFEKAAGLYKKLLSPKGNLYEERAVVRLNELEAEKLKAKGKAATPEEWEAVAEGFKKYKAEAKANPLSDPNRIAARKEALRDADLQIVNAYDAAAKRSKDSAKKALYYEEVVNSSTGFDQRSKAKIAQSFVRRARVVALTKLGRLDEAESEFWILHKSDSGNILTADVAASVGIALKKDADEMAGRTDAQIAKRDEAKKRAGEILSYWITKKPQKKSSLYTYVYRLFYDTGEWQKSLNILQLGFDKFASKPGQEKTVRSFRRRMARCRLELAKEAFNDAKFDEAKSLFTDASNIYQEIIFKKDASGKRIVDADNKPKISAPREVLQEAAQTIGGFLVGPNRLGAYSYFQPDNVDYQLAFDIWKKVEKFSKKTAKTEEQAREYEEARLQSRFYINLTYYLMHKATNNRDALAKLKKNLRVKDQKEGGEPGGPNWAPKYKWLMRQL